MSSQHFLNFLWIEEMNQLIIWQVKTSGTSMKFDSIHKNSVPCHFKTLQNKIDFRKLISIHKYTFVKRNVKRLLIYCRNSSLSKIKITFCSLTSHENEWCKLLILSTRSSVIIHFIKLYQDDLYQSSPWAKSRQLAVWLIICSCMQSRILTFGAKGLRKFIWFKLRL